MRKLALLLAASALVLGGCTHGGEEGEGVEPLEARTTEQTTATPPEAQVPSREEAARTMTDFVEAAGEGNAQAMWGVLSKRTQKRLGPTQPEFEAGAAKGFRKDVGGFARAGGYELILAEPLNLDWGVAAIAGQRTLKGREEYGAYAAALRAEEGT